MPTTGMIVFLDGKEVPASEAKISIFDHGFLFGDSVYEVVRTVSAPPIVRRLFCFDPHMDRLEASARGIALSLPWSRSDIRASVERAAGRVEGRADVYVRVIVTRGQGELDLAPDSCKAPATVIIAKPLPVYPREWYERGIALRLVATMRNPSRAVSPSIKSGTEDLRKADEAFITSTTKDLVPVRTVDGVPLRTSPGELTRKLIAAFSEHVRATIS
ncbi:aminotransferase class IV [bacterium]|nr:aminotransferase class IV [bacterium]